MTKSRHISRTAISLQRLSRRWPTFAQPLDKFFERVTVNDADPAVRKNRLRLLAAVRDTMNLAADFSRIDG